MTIVIALPETTVRDALVKILRKRLSSDAWKIVESGRELEDAVMTFHPELVVMDTLLPEKDGLSVLYELRRLPEDQQPEILLLSSLTSDRIVAEVARLQPAYFTTLPCDVHHLAERILLCAGSGSDWGWSTVPVRNRPLPDACTAWGFLHGQKDIPMPVRRFCGSITTPVWPMR